MTRMTGPDCVVMCNLINTYIHTYIHTPRESENFRIFDGISKDWFHVCNDLYPVGSTPMLPSVWLKPIHTVTVNNAFSRNIWHCIIYHLHS